MCSGLLMLDIFMTFHSRCSESIAKSGTSLIDSLNIKITQPVSRFTPDPLVNFDNCHPKPSCVTHTKL